MGAFANKMEQTLMPIMNRISTQRHLSAVRDGLIATIPLTVIGAIFLLIPYIPWPKAYVSFMAERPELVEKLLIPFTMSLSLLSVYTAFGIGSRLAKSYEMDELSGGILSVFAFLMTIGATSFEAGSFLSMQYMGGEGMFTAIITSILAVEIMHFCKAKKIVIKMPSQVPSNVSSSFEVLIPVFITATLVWLIVHVLGFDINSVIAAVITPIFRISANSIALPLLYVLLTSIMWLFGMHPAILSSIMQPIWLLNAEANMAAFAAGQPIPNIGVQPFIFTFLWIGGGGGTLALCIYMCFSKSKQLKSLGRLSIVPSIFNINEPILFGLPIVLNPVMAIPFTIAPVICVFVTYFAFFTGIVPGMGAPTAAVWTLPCVFAGAIATSSIRGAILVIVNFLIYAVIYYPFFKIYEKRLLAQELQDEELEKVEA